MAISQILLVNRVLHGDGKTTKVVVDFADEVEQSKIKSDHPDAITATVVANPAVEVKSATLSGTEATFEFDPAPVGKFSLDAELLFGKDEEHHSKRGAKGHHGHG